jgi:repressor LexA
LETLERNGYIRRDSSKTRAIEIVDEDFNLARREVVNLPMIGTVAAGTPILAQQNIENYFPIPSEYVPNKECFMLKVKGDSMINAGILSGDSVLVQSQPTAENGDVVVAMIEDSATVKTFYKENGHYRLQPENDTMEPIIVSEVSIVGKVFGILRIMS